MNGGQRTADGGRRTADGVRWIVAGERCARDGGLFWQDVQEVSVLLEEQDPYEETGGTADEHVEGAGGEADFVEAEADGEDVSYEWQPAEKGE